MAPKQSGVPGFKPLSDQVFIRDGTAESSTATNEPDVVMIYGWGDCLPQHVVKYAIGYRELFPHAKQVVVLSPIAKAMYTSLEQRSSSMTPIVKAIFPSDGAAAGKILVHAMSNTGAINFAATLNQYLSMYKKAMPHNLFVMDSTPGGTDFTWSNLKRWSRAMALGTAKWFPWPFVFTQSIWGLFLMLNTLYLFIRRRKHAGAWSRVAANDEKYAVKSARRLYMYSKEDDLIGYQDIEEHVAEAKQKGYACDATVFAGSGHVGHMREHPTQYWEAIRESWEHANSE
ncbi:hypothetical protein VHEMI05354 [[Torrubiella] hemipterigena]|uniref:PaxU n=1 Tax=[Torrubiella] hemipterigena TaxID=1531966 RepID=A0A0A1TGS7_9HYPO|nr:hypothetical protein VHEMI05354 [[Torrubiella] hemipterigena]